MKSQQWFVQQEQGPTYLCRTLQRIHQAPPRLGSDDGGTVQVGWLAAAAFATRLPGRASQNQVERIHCLTVIVRSAMFLSSEFG